MDSTLVALKGLSHASSEDPTTVDGYAELGVRSWQLYLKTGRLELLENAISAGDKAVEFTRPGHPDEARRLFNLGIYFTK